MAIKKEFLKTRSDGINLYKIYSDEGYELIQLESGDVYSEVVDVENANFTYEESDKKYTTA